MHCYPKRGLKVDLYALRTEEALHPHHRHQPFAPWGDIFSDPALTVAAIERLVHHAIVLRMIAASFMRKTAQARVAGFNNESVRLPEYDGIEHAIYVASAVPVTHEKSAYGRWDSGVPIPSRF